MREHDADSRRHEESSPEERTMHNPDLGEDEGDEKGD
jgi:hypothetical protein